MPPSGTFSYVLIPADASSEIKLLEADKEGGLQDDALVAYAKDYFYKQGSGAAKAAALDSATPEQQKQLADQVRAQYAQNPQVQGMTDEQIIGLIKSTHGTPSCEIIALTVPTPGNQYRATSMYISSEQSDAPPTTYNARATALLLTCGHQAPKIEGDNPDGIYGDVFVGRCYDNEASEDEWAREDFVVEDALPGAAWVKVAATKGGGGGSGASSAASLSNVMNQMSVNDQQQQPHKQDLGYTWDQTNDEVELKFAVASGVKAKYVKVAWGRETLKVSVAGQVLVNGATGGKVSVDDCTFTIQDEGNGRELCVVLGKKEPGTIWPHAVQTSS